MLSRRTRSSFSIAQLEEIKRLLEDTDMSLNEIGKRFDTSGEAVRYQGNRMGININERTARLKKPRRKPVESVFSRIPESMTGDGRSLEWLSKEW